MGRIVEGRRPSVRRGRRRRRTIVAGGVRRAGCRPHCRTWSSTARGSRGGTRSCGPGCAPWWPRARASRGGPGRARCRRAPGPAGCISDSYMAAGSLPGKSVRPQPSRKRVSPAISLPSTRKHWLPGVWPGVWTRVIGHVRRPRRRRPRRGRRGRRHPRRSTAPPTGARRPGRGPAPGHLEEPGDALDAPSPEVATDVVGMEVGGRAPRRSACRRRPGCPSSSSMP